MIFTLTGAWRPPLPNKGEAYYESLGNKNNNPPLGIATGRSGERIEVRVLQCQINAP